MVMHPVGPLPASTYWRRRITVLLGLLVLVLVLRSCASGGDAPKRTATTPRPSATTKPTSQPNPRPTASRPPAAVPAACADASLTLTTSTDADTYALGATPKITLVIKNAGSAACRRDLGAGAVELLVYSGADRVWSSDDCNPSTATSVTVLSAGGTQAVVKTWPGVRSLPGCGGSKATAKAGTYKVVARLGSLRVDGSVFRLHA
jgi:hypothetical protein